MSKLFNLFLIMAGNRHVLHSFHHLLIGAILILKGSDKFPHHHLLGGLIFSFGVIIILCFIYIILKKDHSRSFRHYCSSFWSTGMFIHRIYFLWGREKIPPVLFPPGFIRIFYFCNYFIQKRKEAGKSILGIRKAF